MAIYVANKGQLQTIKGIYYGMAEDYINATLFHNLVPKTATEIKFLYTSTNPDLTGYQKLGYCDNNNFIEVWNNDTKYIIINPSKNYIYAPISCSEFLRDYNALTVCIFNNFDTKYVTNMLLMFYGCMSLTSLDITSFNTYNVTNMSAMFNGCSSLTSLDVSGFDTKKVTNMSSMFNSCSGLTSLDLSNFKTDNVTNMLYMFYDCNGLITIISNSFVLKQGLLSPNMFSLCTALVGGNGTTYSSSHVTAEYARVDGENDLPGYFTAPTN